MKNIYFLVAFAILALPLKSQIIVEITQSPNDSTLLGVIDALWADPTSSGWPLTPDMNNANNAIEAELIFVDDNTTDGVIDANGNPTNEDACETVVNDLTGKIAVCYRSFCWHDIKAYYAQQAGAIGVIIINRDPGTFSMGGTTYANNITIPVVSIGSEEGELLKNQIANGGMYAFIGTKVGLHPNDMATSKSDIVMAESSVNPYALSQNGTELNLDLGLFAYNFGTNPQTGVIFNVDIDYQGTSLYNQNSTPVDFASPSGNIVDTQYIDLGNYAPTTWNNGTYTITYSIITQNDDDAPSDNVFTSEFKVTADNVYAKSRTNSANEPLAPTGFYLWEGVTSYDDYEACITFKNSNASRLNAMGLNFSCKPVGGTMSNEIAEIRMYEWNDVFTDLTDPGFPAPASAWTLNQVGSGFYFYPDESQNGVNIYLPFDEAPITMTDNQRYLFCVYTGSDSLKVGFDNKIDYYATVNNYLEYSGPVKTLPAGGSPQWYAAGFGFDVSPSISVDFDITPTSVIENSNNTNLFPYPNPARNLLTIPLRKNTSEMVTVELFDLTGKLLLSETHYANQSVKLNVAAICNGAYFVKIRSLEETLDSFKISINR